VFAQARGKQKEEESLRKTKWIDYRCGHVLGKKMPAIVDDILSNGGSKKVLPYPSGTVTSTNAIEY